MIRLCPEETTLCGKKRKVGPLCSQLELTSHYWLELSLLEMGLILGQPPGRVMSGRGELLLLRMMTIMTMKVVAGAAMDRPPAFLFTHAHFSIFFYLVSIRKDQNLRTNRTRSLSLMRHVKVTRKSFVQTWVFNFITTNW